MDLTYKPSQYGMLWNFIAMEYYLGILNRTYQVFVTPSTIAGAFVQGIMAAPLGLINNWFIPTSYVSQRMMKRYQEVNPDTEQFMRLSPFFNFQYPRSELCRCSYDPTPKWGMGTVAHSGKLNCEFQSGRKREFILLGLQQGKEILRHLQPNLTSEVDLADDSEIHPTIGVIYKEPKNIQAWSRLAELFLARGEITQAFYCQVQMENLKHKLC